MTDADEYEEQWDQLDGKVLLAQILAELQQIRMTLNDADRREEAEAEYRCHKCQAEVPADRRTQHAKDSHNAPDSMAKSMFTRVDA